MDTESGTDGVNVGQREAWNGVSGATWVRYQDRFDATLRGWGELMAEAAGVAPGDRVLDVGCGSGATTLDAARRCAPDGVAVGVDLSEPLIARARERASAEGLTTARFQVGDCQVDDLGTEAYDVVVSRFGSMFFDDPVAAFANIGRAVRPGGRLAMVVWAPMELQEWIMIPLAAALEHLPAPDLGPDAGPGMFALAAPESTTRVLEGAGWRDIRIDRHEQRGPFGGGFSLDETVEFMLSSGIGRLLLADADPAAASRAVDAMRAALAERLAPEGVVLRSVAWLVTARR